MAIPEGYRLLTVDDIGKTFGVDLEPSIFIDSSATLTNSIITASCVRLDSYNGFILGAYIEDGFKYQIQFHYETQYATHFVQFGEFYQDIVDNINAISNINGTITAVGYSNDDDWNTFLYVKDISKEITSNPYNITTDKKYLTINCKDKTMQEDLNITFEGGVSTVEWDGAYEEISSGFTLTLNCTSDVLNSDTYMYSIDGGTTYNQFTSEVMTLENITQIKFKTTASSHNYMKVGTTSGGGEITAGLQSAETENITLSSDIAYYIGRYTQVGGAD